VARRRAPATPRPHSQRAQTASSACSTRPEWKAASACGS
jgi:hypothetical protein